MTSAIQPLAYAVDNPAKPGPATTAPAPRPPPNLQPGIALTVLRHRSGALSDAEFAAHYFLHWQIHRHGARFASRKYKTDPRPNSAAWQQQLMDGADRSQLLPWLERHQFAAVIPNVNTALAHWLRGTWQPTLCAHIPTAREVLRMQTRATRPVTVIADPEHMTKPVLARGNGFEFLTHDLEHVYQFFHDPRLHTLQRALFCVLDRALAAGIFDVYLREAEFVHRFDYLMGDMNTHPLHSLQYLRAQLIEFHLRQIGGDRGVPLPQQARTQITQTLRALGTAGGLSAAADAALRALADGQCNTNDRVALEQALMGGNDGR